MFIFEAILIGLADPKNRRKEFRERAIETIELAEMLTTRRVPAVAAGEGK